MHTIPNTSTQYKVKMSQVIFTLFLIAELSPVKVLGYIAPLIFILYSATSLTSVMYFRFVAINIAYLILITVHFLLIPDFSIQNSVIEYITLSAFWPFVLMPRTFLSTGFVKWLDSLLPKVILFEGIYGIAQGLFGFLTTGSFTGDNGDRVAGTVKPSFYGGADFSNAIFVINMICLSILVIPRIKSVRMRWLTIIISLASIILASVVHAYIFLFIAVVVALLINLVRVARNKRIMLFVLGGVIASALAVSILFTNFELITVYGGRFSAGDSPRAAIIDRTFNVIPSNYPMQPYIGLGPGQFISRAALIGTGLYFGGPLNPVNVPLVTPYVSDLMQKYFMDLWIQAAVTTYYGSTDQPFLSWLAIWAEYGLIGVICAVIFVVKILQRIMTHKYREVLQTTLLIVAVLFIFLLGSQENYWEVPQAIFLGCFLISLFMRYTVIGHTED